MNEKSLCTLMNLPIATRPTENNAVCAILCVYLSQASIFNTITLYLLPGLNYVLEIICIVLFPLFYGSSETTAEQARA